MKDKLMNSLVKIMLIATSYLFAIQALIYVMLGLVLIDFITGIWKAVLANGVWRQCKLFGVSFKLPIAGLNSHTMKRTVVKSTCYFIAILTSFLLENEIFGTGIVVTKIVTGFIAMVEAASIFENLARITGNPVFSKIFDTIKTFFNTRKDLISKIDGTVKDTNENNENNKG